MSPEALPSLDFTATYAEAVRRLGRNPRPGSEGVLEPALAQSTWQGLIEQRWSPAQEAALLTALRLHGESAAMLAAFVRATPVQTLAAPGRTPVVLACAGAARKQASLAPLLALKLVELDVPVLFITASAAGVGNSAGVLTALGQHPATDIASASEALAASGLGWAPLSLISPSLARLMAWRRELGFRNSAHSVFKLIAPVQSPALLATAYTHGAYRETLGGAIEHLQLSACLCRGSEGDPIAWDGEAHPPAAWVRGHPVALPDAAPAARPEANLIAGEDHATADWIRRIQSGDAPWPAAIEAQAKRLASLAAEVPR